MGATRADDPDAADESDAAAIVDALDHPLLLFDGVCNLCNGFVRFVVQFDETGVFRFAPLQSDVGQEVARRHGLNQSDFDTVVLVADGEVSLKSVADHEDLRRLDGPWPLLGPARLLPKRFRDDLYDRVASNRFRLFDQQDACEVPAPELRDRFANRTFE